jgi:hypothetical protein
MYHTSVVEEGAEIATRNVLLNLTLASDRVASKMTYHCKVYALVILEGVKQFDKPLAVSGGENISLCQDMSNFIQFEQKSLAHDFKRTNFSSIFLLRKIDLTIASLPNLREDLEIPVSKPSSSLS